MKRLASRLTWWHNAAPQEHPAVNAAERERPAMNHIAIDVHKRESQIYILAEGMRSSSSASAPSRSVSPPCSGRARARLLIEAATDSEWVARCLESLGHEVIVADPNFAPMYATRTRKVKTDRRDARNLAEACLLGAYHPRPSPLRSPARRARISSSSATPSARRYCPVNQYIELRAVPDHHRRSCIQPDPPRCFGAGAGDAQTGLVVPSRGSISSRIGVLVTAT
jgi:hypothetical protein